MRSQYWEQWITFALHYFKNWLMWVSFRGWRQQGRNSIGCGEGWTWQRFYGENEEERRDFWNILEIKPGGFTDNIYWHTGMGVKQVEMSRWTHEKADIFKFMLSEISKNAEKKILRCHKTEVLMGACLYRQGGGICTNVHTPERVENMCKLSKMGTRMWNVSTAESITKKQ